jgi:hypothetical protein
MTHSQACRPCAKRKVRCDKLEPCSNCKRRKIDRCTYPASTPSDRVRQLESLIRELDGNLDNEPSSPRTVQGDAVHDGKPLLTEMRSNDPMMLEEDGEIQYLES